MAFNQSDHQKQYLPVLTSNSGQTLTPENWRNAGVSMASCSLEELLMKPGIEYLKKLPSLADFFGGDLGLSLNATLPEPDKTGLYKFCSRYDGRKITVSPEEILSIIATLNPQCVVMPSMPGIEASWHHLPKNVMPFYPTHLMPEGDIGRPYGVFINYNDEPEFWATLERYLDKPCYVSGDLDEASIWALWDKGVVYVESDTPIKDAIKGKIYHSEGDLMLLDVQYSMAMSPMDEHCVCRSCKTGLTRAYLHHLITQTPLLCQRFLIEHNVCHIHHKYNT